jgi:ABC-type glycerol-3-phosphate transport system permease component
MGHTLRRMRFFKSAGVGLLAAAVATIATVILWMFAGYAYVWLQMTAGSGGIGAYATALQIPVLVGLVAGIVGFVWQWRRKRPTASA